MENGERPLYPGKLEILHESKREWSGDTAMQSLAPYALLTQSPALFNEKLGLDLDVQALEDIGLAWGHSIKGNWEREQGCQPHHSWSSEAPFAPDAMSLATEEVPFAILSKLQVSDSAFLENPRRVPEWPQGSFRSLRIVDKHPLCLLAVHGEMCHASLYTNFHDYLFFHPSGLLKAIVHLEDPCGDGRSISYARYTWTDSLQIRRLDVWSADESLETMEVHARHDSYQW